MTDETTCDDVDFAPVPGRNRRPYENDPFESGMCTTCYFYKSGRISANEFWRLHEAGHPLAPYNIGKKMEQNTAFDLRTLEDPKVNWREYLRTQQQQVMNHGR